MASVNMGTSEMMKDLRSLLDRNEEEIHVQIKIQNERDLQKLRSELEGLDKKYEANIEINIPDINKKIDELTKKIQGYEGKQKQSLERLQKDIIDSAVKYWNTESTKSGQKLADLIHTYKEITGESFKFNVDLVPNMNRADLEKMLANLSKEKQNGDLEAGKLLPGYQVDYSEQISKLQEQIQNLKNKLASLNQEVEKYDSERANLLSQISEKEAEIARNEEQYEQNKVRKAEEEAQRAEEEARRAEEEAQRAEERAKQEEERAREERKRREKENQSWKTGRSSDDDFDDFDDYDVSSFEQASTRLSDCVGSIKVNLNDIQIELENIIGYIQEKTSAFEEETEAATGLIDYEINDLDLLYKKLVEVIDYVDNISIPDIKLGWEWYEEIRDIDVKRISEVTEKINLLFSAIYQLSGKSDAFVGALYEINTILEKSEELESLLKVLSSYQNQSNSKVLKESNFGSKDLTSDFEKIKTILEGLYKAIQRIADALGTVDDKSGLPNILQQLNEIFNRLEEIQEKAGGGIFNLQIGGSDQSKVVDEKIETKWTEIYQRYMKIYDKIFTSIEKDAFMSPDTIFAKIYSMYPDQLDIDALKNMFGKSTIISLQDPKEQVRRLTEFFKYVQQIIAVVDDESDAMSKAVASVMSEPNNRLQTNFKAIESRVNKIRTDSLPDDATVEQMVKDAVQETQEASKRAEDWQGNLLRILDILTKIQEAFDAIASKDLFGENKLQSFIDSLNQINESLSMFRDSGISIKRPQSDELQNSDQAAKESDYMVLLEESIRKVIAAVEEKTNAFTQEKIAVETAVNYEIKLLDELISKLQYIKDNANLELFSASNDVNGAIEKKNSLFQNEDQIVYNSVKNEIEALEQLRQKLESVWTYIQDQLTAFESYATHLKNITESIHQSLNSSVPSETVGVDNITNLESSLLNIIQLIEDKTSAFNSEGQVVDAVIQAECDKLLLLSENIRNISELLNGLKIPKLNTQWIDKIQGFDQSKIDDITNSINRMFSAISSLDVNDSNFLSSIERILEKGKELENFAKILASSQKKINQVKQQTYESDSKKSYSNELSYLKEIEKLKKEIDEKEAAGRDASIEREKYQPRIDALYDLIKAEVEKRRVQKLSSKELRDNLKAEIDLIRKKNAADIEGIKNAAKIQDSKSIKNDLTNNINLNVKELESAKKSLTDLLNNKKEKLMPDFVTKINDEIDKLDAQIDKLNSKRIDIVNSDDSKELENLTNETKELIQSASKAKADATDAANKIGKDIKIKSLDDQITDFLTKNTKLTADFRRELNELQNKLRGGNLSGQDILNIATAFEDVKIRAKEAGNVGASALDTIGKRLSDMNAKFLAQFFSFYRIIGYGRQILSTIKDLDTQLVDLRKTTTMSTRELNEFYLSSNKIAKKLGSSTSQIIAQAAAWSRLGYSTKEASEQMAALSSKFAAISPGMSLDDATDGLVSAMKAFHIGVEDTEREIMDNVNRIGNTFATSNGEIMEMLKRSSAAMAAANNTIKETIALESAAVQITRNAETTGTAFRTISMRIRGKSLPPYTVMYMLCAQ